MRAAGSRQTAIISVTPPKFDRFVPATLVLRTVFNKNSSKLFTADPDVEPTLDRRFFLSHSRRKESAGTQLSWYLVKVYSTFLSDFIDVRHGYRDNEKKAGLLLNIMATHFPMKAKQSG